MHHAWTLAEMASVVAKLKMYPYFDVANYILMCMMVREDTAPASSDSQALSRKHPLSCWVSSMLMCFASVIVTNMILGEPPIAPFTSHRDLLTATAVWYAINYSPFDIIYKLCKFLPIKTVIYCMKEVQRAHKVHHGVHFASKAYPGAFIIICFVGVLKGAGYYYMRVFERLVRGSWVPTSNEILQPSLATKSCLIASIAFILDDTGFIELPHHILYLAVTAFFLLGRLLYLLAGIHNPFHLFENLVCVVFFGGLIDTLRRALSKPPAVNKLETDGAGTSQSATNSPHSPSMQTLPGKPAAGKPKDE